MSSTCTIAKGQREFPALVKRVEKGELVMVTRHEKPVAYMVSAERMEAMLETMELLANPEFTRALQTERAGATQYHPLNALDA